MGQIQLNQVTKSFGTVEVIPPLDLTIEDGEFVVQANPHVTYGRQWHLTILAMDAMGNESEHVVVAHMFGA